MATMSIIVVATILWLVIFFILLPIGIKIPEKHQPGCAESAPEQHFLGRKLIITSILSLVLTLIYWYIFG